MDFLGHRIDPASIIEVHKSAQPPGAGVSLASLLRGVPDHDVTHGERAYYPLDCDGVTGAFAYPPGGGQGWHTNSNLPGTRVYAAWSEDGNSGMVFYEDGEMRVDRDKPGWNVRAFKVPCWHAVWAECWRISIGFNVAGDK